MTALSLTRSIGTKLLLAFAAIVVLALALTSVIVERSTTDQFESYLTHTQQMEEHHLAGGQPMMGQAENDFLSDVRRSLWIAGGLSGLAAVVLALIVSRQLTRPLRRLAAAAGEIARGNLAVRVNERTQDEAGQVGRAFDTMADALQQQEQARQSFMTDIAHELRNPLSVLRGNLEAIQDGLLEPTPEQVSTLHGQSMALSRLVEDLRTLSLASTGHLDIHRQEMDLRQVAGAVVAGFQPSAAERGIVLSLQAPNELPFVFADPERVGQALRNLIDNALRYTPPGGSVVVSLTADEGQVTVAVADTGGGVTPEDLPHVFDRFYRADRSRSRATGGSGVGLAIVKQLVEAQGGGVSAQSEPGRGSTFAFSLPAPSGP